MQQLCRFLEKQEQLFVAWLEELGQTIGQVGEKYGSRVSQDIALLDKLISELEAKQHQPAWVLVQDIGVTLHRKPPFRNGNVHCFRTNSCSGTCRYQKSDHVHVSWKWGEPMGMQPMDPQLGIVTFFSAIDVILDAETTHPNLIFSDDLKSVRLGNKWDRLPESPERFNSCILALGSPTFLSGCQYWEVEVGDKTGLILGACKATTSRKGSVALSPENGYWVLMRTMHNEYQASAFPPTCLWLKEPPQWVGIFLDYKAGNISFYNVTAKSHIYTFTCCLSSGPLQPVFSPGTHDGGKNTDPLIISPVCVQGPH